HFFAAENAYGCSVRFHFQCVVAANSRSCRALTGAPAPIKTGCLRRTRPPRQRQNQCVADWIWMPVRFCARDVSHTTRESSISPAVSNAEWGWDYSSSRSSATYRAPWPCGCLPYLGGRHSWPWPIEGHISLAFPSRNDSILCQMSQSGVIAACSHTVHRLLEVWPELLPLAANYYISSSASDGNELRTSTDPNPPPAAGLGRK